MVEKALNERSERNRRWAKVLVIAAVGMTILIVLGHRFYVTAQTPYWAALANAEAQAAERLNLKEIHAVERFVGDRPYSIVSGTNAADEDVIVWMWGDELHSKRQDAGLSREEMKALALKENPAKELLRITPGKLNDEYVWEVFYTLRSDKGTRKYYDFYRFTDGVKIETYRLAIER
jgi:uncharacterized protein YpmB